MFFIRTSFHILKLDPIWKFEMFFFKLSLKISTPKISANCFPPTFRILRKLVFCKEPFCSQLTGPSVGLCQHFWQILREQFWLAKLFFWQHFFDNIFLDGAFFLQHFLEFFKLFFWHDWEFIYAHDWEVIISWLGGYTLMIGNLYAHDWGVYIVKCPIEAPWRSLKIV